MLLVGGGITAIVTHQLHVTSAKNKGSIDNPVVVPDDMIGKVTGKGGFSGRTIKAEVYSGTDWALTDVDVVLSNKK
ncbi:MAG: hypothetical protein FJ387_29400 [Verrucomicrobia bacterium]|nr:hypothetical protein [Verrucomicrobiota bacterium]